MKRFLRMSLLVLSAVLAMGIFLWDINQSYPASNHKVIQSLAMIGFFAFAWVWSSYDAACSYRELGQKTYVKNRHYTNLESELFSEQPVHASRPILLMEDDFLGQNCAAENQNVEMKR